MFRRPGVRYGRTPQPETPYQKAAQVWDERIGSARVQAKNWRLMAFGSLILSAGLAASLVWETLGGPPPALGGAGPPPPARAGGWPPRLKITTHPSAESLSTPPLFS